MKKYKVGGSPAITIFMIFWCFIVFAMILGMAYGASHVAEIGFFSIIPMLMLVMGVVMLVRNEIGMSRKKKALSGYPAKGIVKNFYIVHHHSENSYSISQMLEVQYKTESGEDALFVTQVDAKDAHFFEVDKVIPIRVSGEFGYYDIEALGNKKLIIEDSVISKKINCSCGYSFENGLLYCPKCGKAVEDMKECRDEYHGHSNFCPACGSKLDSQDKFCRNCGYKL